MAAIYRWRPGPEAMAYAPPGPRIKSMAATLLGVDSWTATPRGEFLVRNAAEKVLGQKSTSMNLHPEVLNTVQKRVLRRYRADQPNCTEAHCLGHSLTLGYVVHRRTGL